MEHSRSHGPSLAGYLPSQKASFIAIYEKRKESRFHIREVDVCPPRRLCVCPLSPDQQQLVRLLLWLLPGSLWLRGKVTCFKQQNAIITNKKRKKERKSLGTQTQIGMLYCDEHNSSEVGWSFWSQHFYGTCHEIQTKKKKKKRNSTIFHQRFSCKKRLTCEYITQSRSRARPANWMRVTSRRMMIGYSTTMAVIKHLLYFSEFRNLSMHYRGALAYLFRPPFFFSFTACKRVESYIFFFCWYYIVDAFNRSIIAKAPRGLCVALGWFLR